MLLRHTSCLMLLVPWPAGILMGCSSLCMTAREGGEERGGEDDGECAENDKHDDTKRFDFPFERVKEKSCPLFFFFCEQSEVSFHLSG